MTDQDRLIAQERLAILQRAREFKDLLQMPGWHAVERQWTNWLEGRRRALVKADTGEPTKALDALREWQLAEEHYQAMADHINRTLAQAEDIQGTVALDDALMMENIANEHQSAPRPDPTGH